MRQFLFGILLTSLIGCGGGADGGKPVYSASGTVTLFGNPLPTATVAFAPQDGQPTAFGTTDAEGKFTLTTYDFEDGAAAGKFKVVITKSAPAATEAAPEGADHDADGGGGHDGESATGVTASLVPPKYSAVDQTPLQAEVKASGENVFSFDIK
jgi:hypothetical protein